jgi:hypothetical protein
LFVHVKQVISFSHSPQIWDRAFVTADGREYLAAMQVAAIRSIDRQLDKFASEMETDGAVQRARVRNLLDAELERTAAAVSSTLQLSNITSLSSYIFGGDSKKISELPIAAVRSLCCSPMLFRLLRVAPAGGRAWSPIRFSFAVQLLSHVDTSLMW